MARYSKLYQKELIDKLIELIRIGNYVPTACAVVGISEGSYYRWLAVGRKTMESIVDRDDYDELYDRMINLEIPEGFTAEQVRCFEFREKILMASGESEAFAVAMVRKHMPDQWTAAMTFLERRFPGRWKRKEQLDIGDADAGAASGIDEAALLSDPEAVRLVHRALERVAKGELPESVDSTVSDAIVVSDEREPAGAGSGDDESPTA